MDGESYSASRKKDTRHSKWFGGYMCAHNPAIQLLLKHASDECRSSATYMIHDDEYATTC